MDIDEGGIMIGTFKINANMSFVHIRRMFGEEQQEIVIGRDDIDDLEYAVKRIKKYYEYWTK